MLRVTRGAAVTIGGLARVTRATTLRDGAIGVESAMIMSATHAGRDTQCQQDTQGKSLGPKDPRTESKKCYLMILSD